MGYSKGLSWAARFVGIFYNQILEIKTEHEVKLIAYENDLAVIVRANTKQDLEEKAGHAKSLVKWKFDEMRLKMAEAKAEVVLLDRRRTVLDIELRLCDKIRHTRYMPKIAGLTASKRKLVANVAVSVMLYGSPA